MVNDPPTADLHKDINALQAKVRYDRVNDPEFDNRMHMLSIEMISNIEKHKEAWRRISADDDTDCVSLVLEDDAFFIPDLSSNLSQLLKTLPSVLLEGQRKWDICFLGTARQEDPQPTDDAIRFYDTRGVGKIIPTKESYIVAPAITRRLINSLDTIRYTLRTHLSWFLETNRDVRGVYPSRAAFLDGSKFGICTSTIHPINPLVMNREFMDMWHLQGKQEVPISEIRGMYKRIEHLKSPDAMHLYGRLLAERGNHMDAEEAFVEAVRIVRMQQGILGPSSQLLMDAINNYKGIQKDVQEHSKRPSKYTEPDLD
jgi:GR25 family glycosyltransferase involved in LPS biosynthesis